MEKRKYIDNDNSSNKKFKLDNINNDIEKFNSIVNQKYTEKLPDDNLLIKNTIKEISNIQKNIHTEISDLNKKLKSLNDVKKQLKKIRESLCDHNIYSECEYHNDRYYYCRKCSYFW